MACSIVNSISIVDPIWKPFSKKKDFNPYQHYIRNFEILTNKVDVINEIFPLYGYQWIQAELVFEDYFQSKLNKWKLDINSGIKLNIKDVIVEIKLHRRFLNKNYNYLLENNQNIRKLLKENLMANIDLMDYLESLKHLNIKNF